jgi:hypothetical protein
VDPVLGLLALGNALDPERGGAIGLAQEDEPLAVDARDDLRLEERRPERRESLGVERVDDDVRQADLHAVSSAHI